MTSVNSLTTMLDQAFAKFDRNHDGQLDSLEFKPFYEILKPGIAVDQSQKPLVDTQAFFDRMDKNADGAVTQPEMQSTGILMPADLTDSSLHAMLDYMKQQTSEQAQAAAKILAEDGLSAQLT